MCSDRQRVGAAGGSRRLPPRLLRSALVLGLAFAGAAEAKSFLTTDEALRLAFPGCAVSRHTLYLTAEQKRQVQTAAGEEVPSALVTYFAATKGGQPAGTAYLDTHRVRTLPETLLIVVDPQARISRIEVLAFREPEDYLPRGGWFAQFLGKRLDRDLQLKGAIHPVTGATLTARAVTGAVRRVLALHQLLAAGGNP